MPDPLHYDVDLSRRRQHLVSVSLSVPDDLARPLRLAMPTWTPGSYVMRDYVHHLQSIAAFDGDGTAVTLRPDGHTAWRLDDPTATGVTVTWECYANDLTVRTNHVDDHHALIVAPATFVVIEVARDRVHEVHLDTSLPVWSLLPDTDRPGTFAARDLDHLLDSAFEVGDFPTTEIEVAGVPHRFVWAGHGGRPDLDRVGRDLSALATAAIAVFDGDLPVTSYTFLCVGWDVGGGGLEHRDGAVVMLPVTTFDDEDAYARGQSLLAHEYLHLWNVKRLTPAELVRPDPVAHTHTRLLWVAEGWTAYYDDLLPVRAGLWTVERFLRTTGELLDRVWERPGVAWQSVEDASYHAWTKQYVRDENSENAGTDYYSHGAVLAWCLDLLIREQRPDADGLDDAFRVLWRDCGRSAAGYRDVDVRAAVATAAGTDLGWFFDAHVAGRTLPDIDGIVATCGLALERPEPDGGDRPWLGVQTRDDGPRVIVASALRDSPAWTAGVTGGDEIVAIDGEVLAAGGLAARLRRDRAGATVELTVRRGPRILHVPVVLGEPRRLRRLRAVDDPSARQRAVFQRWTGQSL